MLSNATVTINKNTIGPGHPLTVIAGPCQIESQSHAEHVAGTLKEIADHLDVNLIYKSSFDKANRSSVSSTRGTGIEPGLEILNSIKHLYGIPVLTDIHEPWQADACADAGIDVLQIPAFLCRQTDLLLAAGATGLVVNIKKGQFLAPHDMVHAVAKVQSTGNYRVLQTERGYTHGYNNLVVDMRSLPIMGSNGCPVVFDATHSVQLPGGQGRKSDGDRTMAPLLARSAIATGSVDAVFIETHESPDSAPSDGPNMIPLSDMRELLADLSDLHNYIRKTLGQTS